MKSHKMQKENRTMKTPSTLNKKLYPIFISILFLLLNAPSANAQLNGQPDRGFQAGNSYAVSDIEAINMTNGNVSLSIPLASLPKGRGTAPGFSISLTYDSKLWDSEQRWGKDNNNVDYVRNLLRQSDEGGWNVYTDYRLQIINRLDSIYLDHSREECLESNAQNYSKNSYKWKVSIKQPGGGAVNFRPLGYTDEHNDGFFEISPNGHLIQERYGETINGEPSCQIINNTQATTAGMNYYSTDGSGVRLFIPFDNGNTNTNPTTWVRRWTMYYPNGTVIENLPADDSTIRQRITDANGNRVRIKNDSYNGISGTKILDDMERFIFISGDYTKVYQTGYNGAVLETNILWKDVWVYHKYQSVTTLDPIPQLPSGGTFNEIKKRINLVDKITLPTQASSLEYKFTYHADDVEPVAGTSPYTNGWGELASVEIPSKARAEYGYSYPTPLGVGGYLNVLYNSINRKDLKYDESYDGSTVPKTDTWLYYISTGFSSVTAPDGGVTSQEFYDKSPYIPDAGTDWRSGLVHKITNPDGSVINRTWKQQGDPTTAGGQAMNAYIAEEITTITDAGGNPALKTKKQYDYDQNMNLLEAREYDWTAVSSGIFTLKRKTVNTYYNQTLPMNSTTSDGNHYSNPGSPALLKLLKSTEIQQANGTPASRSELYYDNATTSTASPTKGALTLTKSWDSTKGSHSNPLGGNSVSSSAAFDIYGNPTLTTDSENVQTLITYDPIGGYSGLYPTQTIAAYGTSIQRTSTASYDFSTGLTKSATDADNNVTNATEYDALGRPLKIKAAVGTASEIWTQTFYDDVVRRVIVKSDLEAMGDGKKVGIRHYDQLGRVYLSRTLENSATEDPTNINHGIKVQMRYRYDNGGDPANSNGSYSLTSNPYRAATSTAATNEESMGWTVNYTNKTGKTSTTQTFGGAGLPSAFGGNNTNSTGISTVNTDSNYTTVTDPAGKQRRSVTDALGQLVRVDEPDVNGNLGSVSSPVQPTSYSYNTLGKMSEVTQGIQKRHFLHDSLGRMIRVRQPEQIVNSALNLSSPETTNTQWTAGFSYDDNGNMLTATDAKGVTITSGYDALNRVQTRSYSDTVTPPVTYTYDDPNVAYSKGKLTKVYSTISETKYTQYDIMGRLRASEQRTPVGTEMVAQAIPRTSEYKYNQSGVMTEQTYPSGRVVKNFLETDGDLAAIVSKVSNGQFKNYASNFSYTASGVIKSLQLGNGLWESAKLNNHNQVTELNMGNSPTDGSMWKLNYDYGVLNTDGSVDATKNAGNIAKQTVSFNGLAQPFVQTYKYDSLDRIAEAKETNNGNQMWIQNFGYDRYGNRTGFSQNVNGQQLQINNYTLPTVDQNTNRIQTGQGYNYDNGGNLIQDADGTQFTFDGDNKQTEVKNASNVVIGKYFYDGNGKRVKKVTNTETTVFVYDGSGKLIAEYSNATPVQNPTVNYTATDPLGSPRVITNKQGEIVSRRDFMPFGEQLTPDVNYRTTNLKYNYGDNIRQKFTGYQRDEETGLDFAEARYYNNKHGRFTAVDPLLASGKSANPQTFNRYAYTMNRPLNHTDPTGLQAGGRAGSVGERMVRGLFMLLNPIDSYKIGDGSRRGDITGSAMGFAGRSGLSDTLTGTSGQSVYFKGTQVNAVRHTVWQAIITKEIDSDTAETIGKVHEPSVVVNTNNRYFSGSANNLDNADEVTDLLNNEIGRQIGSDNTDASRQELALKVLDYYHNKGLFTATINSNGSVQISQTKLTDKEYKIAVRFINSLNNYAEDEKEATANDKREKKELENTLREQRKKFRR